jgi:predicted RNA-binding Zn-ribbon protein involved in translation (DUF1610 family)
VRVFLKMDGREIPLEPGEVSARAPGFACPHCGGELVVQGRNTRDSQDDRALEADAYTACCGQVRVGTIRAEVDTIFGLREDRAVLQGRCRVY